ncbi:hypothetical protein AYO44_07095 [Planctomycetaceae bacterium SCGC AG-212-F19]|nr:hypothetical protein AYO44_07095 [Planctomycetaceae bacterium SCGC AG-212-F19]
MADGPAQVFRSTHFHTRRKLSRPAAGFGAAAPWFTGYTSGVSNRFLPAAALDRPRQDGLLSSAPSTGKSTMIRTLVSSLPALALAVLLSTAGTALAWPFFGYNEPRGAVSDPYRPSYFGYPLDDYSAGYYGGGRYREYYNFGRGYGVANYPGSMPGPGLPPDYRGNVRHPVYYDVPPVAKPAPPPIMQGEKVAHIIVDVPADAEVWIENQKTQQGGASRWFVSPALEPNQVYEYRIRARWTEQGQQVEQTQKISVQAGERATLGFPTGGKKEVVGSPGPFPLGDKE